MRRPTVAGRRSSLAALVACASVLLTACWGIPSSGPVHDAGQVTGVGDDPFTRIFPAPPADGAKPKDIVAGFLTASASFDDNHAVAREFLTQDAARSWNAGAGAQVYQADTTQSGAGISPLQEIGDHTILFQAPLAGTLSPQGAYTGAASGKQVNADFELRQVGGQWRIASLPQGLLLTSNDLSRAYQPYDIYFPDPARTVVVPDQILVPRGPGASTSLVHALLAGPTAWLSTAVRTAIPAGTKLVVDSVPVTDGVVQVDLTAPAASISRTEAQAMSAQFVWTLRQLGGVTALRLTVDGVPLRAAGVGDAQSIYAWSSFDPDGGTADSQAYAVSDKSRAVLMRGNALQPARGPLGDGSSVISSAVPSFDGTELAALDADHRRLAVSAMTADAKIKVLVQGTALTAPTWDRRGDVWVVDRAGATTSVWDASPSSGLKRKVAVDGLPGGAVRAMRLARDGVRVAMLVDDSRGVGQVYVGLVERSGAALAISSFRPVSTSPGFATSVDVAWASADRLVVLGRAKPVDPVEAWLVDLNGSVEQGYGAPTDGALVALTAAPTHPPLAGSSDGRLWVYSGLGWSKWGGAGTSPAYPG